MKNKKKRFRSQIVSTFLITSALMYLVNFFIFSNMKSVIDNTDKAYDGNRRLMEMRDRLDSLQLGMQAYTNTKDEVILNKFYADEEKYKELIGVLQHDTVMTELQIREQGLYNLSTNYIQTVNQVVLAKKSRNVEEYQTYQTKASEEYGYITSYMTDLNNTMFQNNSEVYKSMITLTKYSEVLYGAILILTGGIAVCLLLVLTKRLSEPLGKLADTALEVGEGNLDVMLVDNSDIYEIGIVNSSFNQMVMSLKDYIEKFRKSVETESALREKSIRMEASYKDAQLKYLQAQIDPHFLFNTLNAGAQLAMMENADKTYKYIHKVADFFRTKIKKDDPISTLENELKIVDDYVYILNVRYSDELIYTKSVDDNLTDVSMPSMILQPIIENSVKHGLSEVEWEKHIDVSVTEEEDNIVVSLSDNGVGIPQDIIEKIIKGDSLNEYNREVNIGIGLDNVIERLRNFYNREDVIEITSVGPNMGTEVAIYIPKA
ncbi:MAG: histidine kinase [Lachnospiraceae bacterium]|nr:histidine kinase [Lachnospiraceae bacterium]